MTMSKKYTRTKNSICVVGIDPGYARLGIAVVDNREHGGKKILLYSGCVETSKNTAHEIRLYEIARAFSSVVETYQPDLLSIEKIFLNTNQKTAISVAESRGVILSEAARYGIRVSEYTPLQIKIAMTGYGRSDKAQVRDMVSRFIAIDDSPKKRLDDEYDAIAAALTCLAHNY